MGWFGNSTNESKRQLTYTLENGIEIFSSEILKEGKLVDRFFNFPDVPSKDACYLSADQMNEFIGVVSGGDWAFDESKKFLRGSFNYDSEGGYIVRVLKNPFKIKKYGPVIEIDVVN